MRAYAGKLLGRDEADDVAQEVFIKVGRSLGTLTLSELEDLSNEEIARRLSLSLATVKIRLHRARAKLYEKLRRSCRCYHNQHGELMGEPKTDEEDAP